jgi:hypothetical protein
MEDKLTVTYPWVERHPGHGSQKVHGFRFGGGGSSGVDVATARKVAKRIDDKDTRKNYLERVRQRHGEGAKVGANLSGGAKTGVIVAYTPGRKVPVNPKTKPFVDELKKNKLGIEKDGEFVLNKKGIELAQRIMDDDPDATVFHFGGSTNSASQYYRGRLNDAKTNKERIKLAENSLKVTGLKDYSIKTNKADIPTVSGNISPNMIQKKGVNAVYQRDDKEWAVGKILERDGGYYDGNLNRLDKVQPYFRK